SSLPDVLMPVELRSASGLGVIAMPDANGVESHGRGGLFDGFCIAFGAHKIVAGHMTVACVEANGDGSVALEARDELRHLLEAAAEGKLRAGRVFDKDMERSSLPRQPVDGALDGVRREPQAFLAGEPSPRAG